MQHHSTTRQEAATATALVLTIVTEPESTPLAESFHLHVASRNHKTAAHKPFHQTRRSTIDDNGGSYEGL